MTRSTKLFAAALMLGSLVALTTAEAEHHQTNDAHTDHEGHAMTKDTTHRASKIIGLTVKNGAGKELGEINDFVVNSRTGKIEYVAVSFGGFAGIGDKLFAVPFTSVDCRKKNDEAYVVVDVDQKTLENAKGFDQDNWPDMANPQWRSQNDRNFKSKAGSSSRTNVRSNAS